MHKLNKFVNMAIEQNRTEEAMPMMQDTPVYPYGLSICLCNDELEKLGLDASCEVGDMITMECLAKVTSVSKNDTTEGTKTRVELQIVAIATEDEEESVMPSHNLGRKSPY
jgi:hypothetical protein